jgi:hypothetical protein
VAGDQRFKLCNKWVWSPPLSQSSLSPIKLGGRECLLRRRFSRPLGYRLPIHSVLSKNMVGRERLELSIPKALVSKTNAYAFRHRPMEYSCGLEPHKICFAGRCLDHFSFEYVYKLR